jgi:phage terminase Nu1 subunit (DNA packaging protein)
MPKKSLADVEVSQKEIAGIFEVSIAAIKVWEKDYDPPLPAVSRGTRGQANVYSLRDVTRWLAERRLPVARYADPIPFGQKRNPNPNENDSQEPEFLNYDQQKARQAKETADKYQLENAVKRNELVKVEDITSAVAKVAQEVRSIIDSIPLRIKKAYPHLGAAEIEGIRKELVKALNAAAKFSGLDSELTK